MTRAWSGTPDQACAVTQREELRLERLHVARLAKHLIHFVQMQFFPDDHFAGILFQQHGLALRQFQQFVIRGGSGLLPTSWLRRFALLTVHALPAAGNGGGVSENGK